MGHRNSLRFCILIKRCVVRVSSWNVVFPHPTDDILADLHVEFEIKNLYYRPGLCILVTRWAVVGVSWLLHAAQLKFDTRCIA